MTDRLVLAIGAVCSIAVLAACGGSKSHPRPNPPCGPRFQHRHGCPPESARGHVGAPAPPGVVCTQTLSAGADVQAALSSASPGAVVCLNAGDWPALTLDAIAPAAPGVTLAATPGQSVVVPGFTVTGPNTQNLTIEGFSVTVPGNVGRAEDGNPNNGFQLLCGISGGVTLQYNTVEHQPGGDGFFAYADNCGTGHTQRGITVAYNQIDHVENALQVNGGLKEEANLKFAHNVVGPYIQDGGYGHYVQIQGISGLTMDNNAFEGPPDPRYENCAASGAASHLNVLHVDTGQRSVAFDNNILWHVGSCGESLLLQNTPMDNIHIDNNLDVEAPACNNNEQNGCQAQFLLIEAPHGLGFLHNTSVNAARGLSLGYVSREDATYPTPKDMTAAYNVVAPAPREAGQRNYSSWDCTGICTARRNVSADGSARTVLGGSGNVVNWAARWRNTSWTPGHGVGYEAPPPGYYQPEGLPISDAGYQGRIGP